MILNDTEIIKLSQSKDMIKPLQISKVQSASYDLKISPFISRFKNDFVRINLLSEINYDDLYETVGITEGYDLKPKELIFVKIKEKIKLPSNIAAQIVLRNSLLRLGLSLESPFINPTYTGNLHISLKNNSPFVIQIMPDLIFAQIVFFKLSDNPTKERLYANKLDAKFYDENSIVVKNTNKAEAIINTFFDNYEKNKSDN